MSPRLRPVWVLAAAVVLVVAGCGTSADPETWDEAEQDARFVEAELKSAPGVQSESKSAVEHNFIESCMEANARNLNQSEALFLCRCSFDGLRDALTLQEFQSLDKALRETPNPSDLDDDPEDLWDDIAEGILRACAERVDT